jgi:predicted phage terminase large subunit-like protein
MPDDGREQIEIRPQPGPQTIFLSTSADIAIYGGAAGGGKSFGLLLEPTRHKDKPGFGGVIFRRDRQQITNEGGLWDEAAEIYPNLGGKDNASDLFYTFPSGSSIGFAGLQYEIDVRKWQGSQIAFLGFDELTHFTEFQFFYMLSRNRSTSAVRSYVRATCNPDADSWVADFIAWWIDQKTGFPVPERAGVVRWLVRNNNRNYWFDTKDEAEDAAAAMFPNEVERFGPDMFAKSVTFIPADLFDNPALLARDPGYLANLLALPLIERERLLNGNWKVKATAGKVYNREWFEIVDDVPTGGTDVRFWDLAATEAKVKNKKGKNDPDYTATVKMRYKAGVWYIVDAFQIQTAPANVEKLVKSVAELDVREAKANKARYRLRWEIEPGSASVRENQRWVNMFRGLDAKGVGTGGMDKLARARACSVQAEFGNVKMLRADWNSELLTQLHGFPDLPHDDLFDATSGSFNAALESGQVLTD